MNQFVAYMQYLASVEQNTAPKLPHGVPLDEANGLEGSTSSPCSPLIMPSPSLPKDLLDFPTQESSHTEGHAASVLFQPSNSTFENMSPSLGCYRIAFCDPKHQPPSDTYAPSFEAVAYTLADAALNLTPTVKSSIFNAWDLYSYRDNSFAQSSLKEHAPLEVLEQVFSLLMDAREAITLRRSIVLTEIGFYLEEIRTKLRIYDGDGETLAVISGKITETEALAQSQRSLLDFPALHRHQTSSRHGQLSFSQRNRPFLCQMQPVLNETKHLRQEASVFVTDHLSFPWR